MEYAKFIGKAKSMEILFALEEGKLTFGRIKNIAGNSTTATRRLKEMLKIGIIKREFAENKLGTVEYRLTTKGKEVIRIMKRLEKL